MSTKTYLKNGGLNSCKIIMVMTILSSFISSCVSQRKIEYMRDRTNTIQAFNETEFPDYRLKSNDELYISIKSLDDASVNIFSNLTLQPITYDPYAASLLSYSVDKEGYVLLPVVGSIFVEGKTLPEVSHILQDSLNHILNKPLVSVKLVNRYVSVLGEVKAPGHYPITQEKLTIFDAISLAGDITDYGTRDEVTLVRNEDGRNVIANLDLGKTDILASGFYYLKPNDIVYIRPLRGNKFWQLRQVSLSILLSAITTGLLIYEIVKGN
jgi:polysaccharide biosynthesis/export protein